MGRPIFGWTPWLMDKIVKLNASVVSLSMPNPNEPIKEEWVAKITEELGKPGEDKYLVGHSLGSVAILRYLETLSTEERIGGVFLISCPMEKLHTNNDQSKLRLIDNFLESKFDFDKIKKVCKNFVIVHGDNDAKVPLFHAEKLRDFLSAELIIVNGGGHLGEMDGVYELPQLWESILKIIK